MAEAVLIWAYISPMPFAWCRVFFGLRGHRAFARRWLLASAIAVVWPLYGAQYLAWKRFRKPDTSLPETLGDEIAAEFHALYP